LRSTGRRDNSSSAVGMSGPICHPAGSGRGQVAERQSALTDDQRCPPIPTPSGPGRGSRPGLGDHSQRRSPIGFSRVVETMRGVAPWRPESPSAAPVRVAAAPGQWMPGLEVGRTAFATPTAGWATVGGLFGRRASPTDQKVGGSSPFGRARSAGRWPAVLLDRLFCSSSCMDGGCHVGAMWVRPLMASSPRVSAS